MEALLAYTPDSGWSAEPGGIGFTDSRFEVSGGSEVFHRLLVDLGSDAHHPNPAEPLDEFAGELEGGEIQALMLAVAMNSAVDFKQTPAFQEAESTTELPADSESESGSPSALPGAWPQPSPERLPRTADTSGLMTVTRSTVYAEATAVGLPALVGESATLTGAPAVHDPGQPMSDVGSNAGHTVPGEPLPLVLNHQTHAPRVEESLEHGDAESFQPPASPFVESRNQTEHQKGTFGAQSVENFLSARTKSDPGAQAWPSGVTKDDPHASPSAEGPHRTSDLSEGIPHAIAAATLGDEANRQGEGQGADWLFTSEQNKQTLANEPEDRSFGPAHQADRGVQPTSAMVHALSIPATGTGLTQPESPLEPAMVRPNPFLWPRDGVGEADDAKTVQAIQVNLDPNDLGRMRIRVVLADSTVHAQVSTEYTDVGQFLINRRDQLESALEASGLDMGQFRVHIDREGSGQSANDWIAGTFENRSPHTERRQERVEADPESPAVSEPRGLSVFA